MRRVKPKPLYQSLTFWSGILVMGFICWAWWDSMHSRMVAQVGRTRMYSAGGEIGFFHRPDGFPSYQRFRKVAGRFKVLDGLPSSMLAVPLNTGEERSPFNSPRLGRGKNTLYLPYWLFLVPVILPWTGLLLYRARRHRMAMQPLTG